MTNTVTEAKGTIVAQSNIAFRPGPDIPAQPNPLLVSILRTKRAHLSAGDTNFRMWLHSYLEQLTGKKAEIKAEGCIVVTTDPKSDTLFSCHIDTVHSNAESDGSPQDLAYDPSFGHIVLAPGSKSGCLGADDGAGIYVMLRMIEAKVPGSYIFHTGEEHGGIGSNAVLKKDQQWLDSFSRAIAFDRAVQSQDSPEVICSQGGHPCASLEFGKALVNELNKFEDLFADNWVISHKGSFTDTKVYNYVIPECVNLGVFYARQHSPQEFLDVAHLESLVTAACKIKWDELKAVRKPPSAPVYDMNSWKKPKQNNFAKLDKDEEAYWESQFNKNKAAAQKSVSQAIKPKEPEVFSPLDYIADMDTFTKSDYLEFVETDPDMAAAVMAILVSKYRAAQTELEILTSFMSSV